MKLIIKGLFTREQDWLKKENINSNRAFAKLIKMDIAGIACLPFLC